MKLSEKLVDVLIHLADGFVYDELDYATRIEERLAAAGLSVERRNLVDTVGEPAPPARIHLLTGGSTSVLSANPWMHSAIAETRALIDRAEFERHTVVGVCLGSQIVAEALRSGVVAPAPAIEVGFVEVAESDGAAREIVPSFHYESITRALTLEPGVCIELRSEHTDVQSFSYGDRVFGYQFHPEFRSSDMHRLIDYNAAIIGARNGQVAAAHRSVDGYLPRFSGDLFERLVIDRALSLS